MEKFSGFIFLYFITYSSFLFLDICAYVILYFIVYFSYFIRLFYICILSNIIYLLFCKKKKFFPND